MAEDETAGPNVRELQTGLARPGSTSSSEGPLLLYALKR